MQDNDHDNQPPSATNEARSEVGYKRPPKHTRFRKGASGNPSGKNGASNPRFMIELLQELQRSVAVITPDGKRQFLAQQTVLIRGLMTDAAKGKPHARALLLRLLQIAERIDPTPPPSPLMWTPPHKRRQAFDAVRELLAKIVERARAEAMDEAEQKFERLARERGDPVP